MTTPKKIKRKAKKIKEEAKERKRFSNNRRLRMAASIIKILDGATNEEKLGQFEMIAHSESFQRRFPGLLGKDVATLIRLQLSKY